MPDIWSVLTILSKWALYAGILGAAGTAICALIFKLDQWRGLAFGFAVLGLFAAVLSFMLKGVALTGDAYGMIDPEMLALLWDTKSGTAFVYQLTGLLILSVGLLSGAVGSAIASMGGAVALLSFVIIGHVADRESLLLDIILVLHLVIAAFWIGILIPLRRLTQSEDSLPEAALLGHHFGRIASLVIPLLLIAGALMTWELVGSPAKMIGTSYGQTLLVKIIVVVLLLMLAAANKMRFVPALENGDMNAAKHLTNSIAFEWAAVLAILLATATFTSVLTLPT